MVMIWGVAFVAGALLIANFISGSSRPREASRSAPGEPTDSMGAPPSDVRRIAVNARPALVENSGVTMSPGQPDIIFTINDSGNEPIVYALDTTGADRGAWRIRDAMNVDWEAISSGPCRGSGVQAGRDARRRCLYIGDVGDNDAIRSTLTLYRVAAPVARAAGATASLAAEVLRVRLEGGAHDIEAMYVALDATVYLISKRAARTRSGQLRPAQVFAIQSSAWATGSTVARRIDSLPIVPGSVPFRTVTDASLSADGRYLAVRTYFQVYVFAAVPRTGRLRSSVPPAICDVASLDEPQGEGISWYGSTTKLLLSSEGRAEPLRLIECPFPVIPRSQ